MADAKSLRSPSTDLSAEKHKESRQQNAGFRLKGTATLISSMFYMKELYEPWILIPVKSKSVEKYGSCGRLNKCKWTIMEAAIL